MKAADELAKHVGVKPACAALEVSRSTLYRRRGPSTGQQQPRPTPARALSETERGEVFDTLCSERFVDRSPAEVVATLLDEEVYLCSERTMYRVLASEVPVQERRAQRTHPEYKKPELMATAPNQVWSWDITRLLGPKKWSYYYLYVIMDIYSRYVVGWMVADRENSALAGRLIQQSCLKHGVQPRVLTLHSDRGAPRTSQCTAQLLADLGVTRSLSRPQVSDDNPFSEAQFKTLKYHPSFPGRFGDQGQAKTFCRSFFRWYNAEHRHGGISMLTPEQVHFGERRSGHCRQEIRAPRSMGRSSRTLRQRCAEAQTAPGGRLHQSSHPFPHHTGHCSLINPVECPIVVDRFRSGNDGPRLWSITRTREASTRLSRSGGAANRRAYGRRWARWATATRMPFSRHVSRRSSVSSSTAIGSRPRPRRGWRFSGSSRAGTTRGGGTPPWGYESPKSFEENHANRSAACPAAAGTATFNEPGMLLLPCASGAAEASDSKGSWEKRENTST